MLFWTILKVSLKSLMANKLRSFLAILGIILGVASVIAMVSLVGGATKSVTQRIKSMGTNLLVIRPGAKGHRGVKKGTFENLTIKDALKILDKIETIKRVAPVVQGSIHTKYMNQNASTSIIGTSPTYFKIRNYELEEGRIFKEAEVNTRSKVCVAGAEIIKNLFGKKPYLNKIIKVKGMNFKIIGKLKSKGDMGWFNPDDLLIAPYTTVMKNILGVTKLREIDIQVEEEKFIDETMQKTSMLMRNLHKLKEGEDDDFHIRNQQEHLENLTSITKTFTLLLGSIAAISLLVGGIGIMNIMLVTVTERTREIGIRKAIGALDRDILQQFLIEASIISGLGGIFGILLGISTSFAIKYFLKFETATNYYAMAISFAFSALVGVFFGFYPAKKASDLNPIEALRYE